MRHKLLPVDLFTGLAVLFLAIGIVALTSPPVFPRLTGTWYAKDGSLEITEDRFTYGSHCYPYRNQGQRLILDTGSNGQEVSVEVRWDQGHLRLFFPPDELSFFGRTGWIPFERTELSGMNRALPDDSLVDSQGNPDVSPQILRRQLLPQAYCAPFPYR